MRRILAAAMFAAVITANPLHTSSGHFRIPNGEIKSPPRPIVKQVCNVSAYTASVRECGKDDGITASGVKARAGITAAADHLPFGTIIILPDGSRRIIQDRFGGGYKDRIDIYHESEQAAWDFGRRQIEVEIVETVADR